MAYDGVAVTPEQKEPELDREKFEMSPDQMKRATFVTKRINLMDQEKCKYIAKKRCSLMLYDGIIEGNSFPNKKKAEVVSPFARTFVESKTAEELKTQSEYVLLPVDDEQDAWKAELLMQTIEHVKRVTYARAKSHELKRMKNIVGQSVKWKTFRKTTVKMNVTTETDESGVPTKWTEMDVPGESDIIEEVIDVVNDFWIDPNAGGAHDALDCAFRFQMNHEEAEEIFSGEMYDFEGVGAGADGMVEGIMYFKKPSGKPDMMCIYCWPSVNQGVRGMAVGHVKEVYYGGLPDEHKMLPIVTYVNVPTFTHGFFGEIARSSSGEAATPSGNVSGKQKFWAYAGDPEIIMDLIDLRTNFGRSLYKAAELASRSWTATAGNFRIDNSVDWEHGDQIVGGMNKFTTGTWGSPNLQPLTFSLDDIYSQMIQALGTDPRNLTDTKQKTLGETIAQRESQFTRLEATTDYSNELSEIRDGVITHKLVQQWYTEPRMVRLTGLETDKELEKFDEVEGEHPKTGKPMIGKQYRRIRTSKPMKELKAGTQNKLVTRDAETYSFIARPEYIRTSDMDIAVVTKKRAGELQALKAEQLAEAIGKFVEVFPMTQPSFPGEKPLISPDELPPIGDLLKEYWKVLGVSGKDKVKGSSEEEIKKMQEERKKTNAMRKPIAEVPIITPEE